ESLGSTPLSPIKPRRGECRSAVETQRSREEEDGRLAAAAAASHAPAARWTGHGGAAHSAVCSLDFILVKRRRKSKERCKCRTQLLKRVACEVHGSMYG
ncbi:Os08g0177550, partial [Oryza sativa Japonica Group]